ncbi:hypothetical protein Scep_022813 [Stephania cephalantha]|uniref:Uncharacterized protein n=1 Tax=Stephania cephalantha TaxID=152367 RepID=A0AAP0FJ14_9MAGN
MCIASLRRTLSASFYPFRSSSVLGLISSSICSALDCPLNYARNYLPHLLPSASAASSTSTPTFSSSTTSLSSLPPGPLGFSIVLAAPEYCNANFTSYVTPTFWSNPALSLSFFDRRPATSTPGSCSLTYNGGARGYTPSKLRSGWSSKKNGDLRIGVPPSIPSCFAVTLPPWITGSGSKDGLGGDNFRGLCQDLHHGPVSLLHWSGKGKPWACPSPQMFWSLSSLSPKSIDQNVPPQPPLSRQIFNRLH